MLAAPLADSARAYLVLDGSATTIRHASPAAAGLAAAVGDADGTLAPGLANQIRVAGSTDKPRLVRLRLDPRRIAPPTACLIAEGALDAAPALLLVVAGPLPAFRPRLPPAVPQGAAEPAAAAESEPAAIVAAIPTAGDRFVWRSDADDRLTAISGPRSGALAPVLVGRSWAGLARDGRLTAADTFLSALDARRTFRAAPAALDLDAAGTLALELSGARLGRVGEAFSGFGGYGVVRDVTAPTAEMPLAIEPPSAGTPSQMHAEAPDAYDSSGAADAAPEPETSASEAGILLPDIQAAAWPPSIVTAARFGVSSIGADLSDAMPDPAPPAPASAEPGVAVLPLASEPAAVVPPDRAVEAPDVPETALSVTEHAAFREIARALGARYAGDDESGAAAHEGAAARSEGGAVMPFPLAKPSGSDAPPHAEPADAASLDDLPAAFLIHRGDAVLAANRRLLDLAGYADVAGLQAAGLGRLFRGLPPDRHDADAERGAPRPILIETAGGGSRPVAVEHGPLVWRGAAAECLILRAVVEADPAGAQAAERLAQTFRDGHAADARAALDALEDGVVTLDPAARIVAMNRAAAGLLACDPREVVGTGFDALFEPSQRDAVGASIAGLGTETRTVAAGGRPLALRVTGHAGTRVAVLRVVTEGPARRASGFDHPAFLGRLDREIRTPVEGIVRLADGILAESHGAIDEGDRATLRAIRGSASHVCGLVADLFDLATIESGGLALAVRPLPLNDLVSGCVALLQSEAARGRIVLRTSFSPDLAPLEADEPSMRQAALTVIGHAIRETGAGGQVIVSTTPGERGGAALKVRGTGPGRNSAEIEDALEPLGAGTVPGTGLGLPLTRALVEANHGCLRVSSHGAEGTLVEILLPGPQSRSA